MPVLLYGMDLSHYVVKVKRILEYKGIDYEYEYAPYNDRQELLAISGQDYVPYLLWDDQGYTWDQIPTLLETKRPTPTLFPHGERHLARMLENWAHDTVEELAWRVVAPDARKVFKDAREAWVFEELQRRKRGDLDEMALLKPKYTRELVEGLGPTNDRLGESPFLVGPQPSVADFALYGALHCLPYTGNEIPRELGNVRKWYTTVGALGKK